MIDSLFALLIVGSVISKAVVLQTDPPLSNDETMSDAKLSLQQAGIDAHLKTFARVGAIVYGARGSCRLWAADFVPYGVRLAEYREWARPYGPLKFVYRGAIYEKPPKFGPLMRYFVARELARTGLRPNRSPVIAVAASSECDLRAVDWTSLKTVAW